MLMNKSLEIVLKIAALIKGVNKVTQADAAPSTAAPTKAEFDAVVALANQNKAQLNALIDALNSKNQNA